MIRARSLVVAPALALALVGGGCGDSDDPPSPPAREPATTGTATSPGAGDGDIARTRNALNVIVAECTRRRRERGRVGGVSRRFERSVRILIGQFDTMPYQRIEVRPGEPRTTLRAILRRVSTSLRQEAPNGCGANIRAGNTTELADDIQRALQRRR